MYCVLNTITACVLITGTKLECQVFIEKNPSYERFCKIMKILEIEGEVIPYDEYFSPGSGLAYKRDLSCG
jgi:hypothetical protein